MILGRLLIAVLVLLVLHVGARPSRSQNLSAPSQPLVAVPPLGADLPWPAAIREPKTAPSVIERPATPGEPRPAGGASVVVALDWRGAGGLRAEVTATWRERPDRPGAPGHPVSLNLLGAAADGRLPEALSLGEPRPGVYTFHLRYEGAVSTDEVRVTIHTADAGMLRIRERRLSGLSGGGSVVLARMLLPQGIHWEQDEWFSGRSENGQVVTKFRFPEAITWSERKVDTE
jgi:hypothetical protein